MKEDKQLEEMELGTLLKKARQSKGLTIDQIQEETKIRKKYLQAIEENNFEVLPGTVYLKVFVKGYARLVDLNYQALLDNYPVLHQEEEKLEKTDKQEYLSSTKLKRRTAKYRSYKNIFKWIVLIFFAFVLILGSVFVYQYLTNAELRLLDEPQVEENINEVSENQNEESESVSGQDNGQEETEEESAAVENEDLDNQIDDELPTSEDDQENIADQTDIVFTEDDSDPSIDSEIESDSILDNNLDTDNLINSEDQSADEDSSEIIFNQESTQSEESAEVDNNEAETESAESAAAAEESEDSEASEASEERTENNIQSAEITINNDERVWLSVTADEENVFSGILEVEDTLDYEIEERLYMKIGLADAVTVNVNGEEYGPFSAQADIAEVEFLIEDGEVVFNNLRE